MTSMAGKAPSGNRKRPTSNARSKSPKIQPEDGHVTKTGPKRTRTGAYSSKIMEITPINYKKRLATSQDPDEEKGETVDDYQTAYSQTFEQTLPKKSMQRAKKDTGLDAKPLLQVGKVSQRINDQDFYKSVSEGYYKSENEEYPTPEAQEESQPQKGEDGDGSESGEVEEDDDNGDIPANPPTQAFLVQPPAKDVSWKKNQYAPTLPYTSQLDCPINWAYVKSRGSGLTDAHIQAYIHREPWVPSGGEVGYDIIVEMFHKAGDDSVTSLEGARKRFGKANLAVFETTGVWFEGSTSGLREYKIRGRTAAELQKDRVNQKNVATAANKAVASADVDCDYDDDVEVPDPENPLPVKQELRPGDSLITFILQPENHAPNDRCVQCCELGLCYDEKCRKAWLKFRNSSDADSGSDSDDSDFGYVDEKDEDVIYHIGAHSSRRWAQVLSQQRAPFGCHIHQPLTRRFIHSEKFEAVYDSESTLESVYLADVSYKAFDLYSSCFAPEFLRKFPDNPQRLDVYLDKEDADDDEDFSKAVYEDIGGYTVADLLEAYCCSQCMNCPAVSDVLLNNLRSIVKAQRFSLRLFEPRNLGYVFDCTNASDPIRLFLFDVFRLNMVEGEQMMQQYRHLYPPQLVWYWDYWKHQQHQDISAKDLQEIDNFHKWGWQGKRGAANGLRGIFRMVPESDEHPDDQEGVIWGNCIFERWSHKMGKSLPDRLSLEALHERFTQSDSIDALSSDNVTLFWDAYHNRSENED